MRINLNLSRPQTQFHDNFRYGPYYGGGSQEEEVQNL